MEYVVYLENKKKGVVGSYGPFAVQASVMEFVTRGLNNKGIIITYGPEAVEYGSVSERDLERMKKAILGSGAAFRSKETLPDGRICEHINLVEGYEIRSELLHWII